MKKFVGQLKAGDVINVRIKGSLIKTACTVTEIEFFDEGEGFEHALMSLDNGVDQTKQTWYTVETVEVVA